MVLKEFISLKNTQKSNKVIFYLEWAELKTCLASGEKKFKCSPQALKEPPEANPAQSRHTTGEMEHPHDLSLEGIIFFIV